VRAGRQWATITRQLGWQPLGRATRRSVRGSSRAQVEIERRLDGSHWLRFRGRYLRLRHCPAPLRASASPSGLRPPGLTEQTPRPKSKSNPNIMCPHITLEETMEPDISILRKPDISTLR